MLQQLSLFLIWLASPQGFVIAEGLLALGAALGLNPRLMAGLLAALSFWVALA